MIDRGDPAFGLPPYNGGLFDEARTPLLARVRLSNRVMADVIDALSFERPSGPAAQAERRYINYRSLSVQQLGSIYERLLEYETVREDGGIVVRPNVFARKGVRQLLHAGRPGRPHPGRNRRPAGATKAGRVSYRGYRL